MKVPKGIKRLQVPSTGSKRFRGSKQVLEGCRGFEVPTLFHVRWFCFIVIKGF